MNILGHFLPFVTREKNFVDFSFLPLGANSSLLELTPFKREQKLFDRVVSLKSVSISLTSNVWENGNVIYFIPTFMTSTMPDQILFIEEPHTAFITFVWHTDTILLRVAHSVLSYLL